MKENSFPQKILLAIGEKAKDFEDFLNVGFDIMFDYPRFIRGISFHSANKQLFHKGISNLKKSGYIEIRGIENEKKLCLTFKGRIEIIKNILKQKKKKEQKWDRKWRAVIFDIPELSKKDRDFLRRELVWVGFKELQKSIWVYPFEIEKELRALLGFWKTDFTGDIRFLKIEKLEYDTDLRESFNLD